MAFEGDITQSEPPPPRISSAPPPHCKHGITFDENAAKLLNARDVRLRWPRLFGPCPLGCGYSGIAYASTAHYVYGDW